MPTMEQAQCFGKFKLMRDGKEVFSQAYDKLSGAIMAAFNHSLITENYIDDVEIWDISRPNHVKIVAIFNSGGLNVT